MIAEARFVEKFVALDRILVNQVTLSEATGRIVEVAATHQQLDRVSADGSHRTVVVPLVISPARLHRVVLLSGPRQESLSPRDLRGAWLFDLTISINSRSDEASDIFEYPPEQWPSLRRHSIAHVLSTPFIVSECDQRVALARMVRDDRA